MEKSKKGLGGLVSSASLGSLGLLHFIACPIHGLVGGVLLASGVAGTHLTNIHDTIIHDYMTPVVASIRRDTKDYDSHNCDQTRDHFHERSYEENPNERIAHDVVDYGSGALLIGSLGLMGVSLYRRRQHQD